MTDRVRDRLFDTNPYDGLDLSQYPDDIQGWWSDHPVMPNAISVLRPRRIVEVGSWKGRSAINMATKVRTMGLDCEIVCVDTWLGSPEHWIGHGGEWRPSLSLRHGYPQMYFVFLSNILRRGLDDIVTPMPMTSDNAAHVLAELGLKFDIAYIDAAHEYGPVKRDLENYWQLLDNKGVLIADDYQVLAGVTQAVQEFVYEHGCAMQSVLGKCLLFKPGADSSVQIWN